MSRRTGSGHLRLEHRDRRYVLVGTFLDAWDGTVDIQRSFEHSRNTDAAGLPYRRGWSGVLTAHINVYDVHSYNSRLNIQHSPWSKRLKLQGKASISIPACVNL